MKVELNEQNTKRFEVFFPLDQVEVLVNDIVDNAFTDFLVFVENLDNVRFKKYYEELTK